MALPKAAQKQIEAAEKLHAETYPETAAPEGTVLAEVPNDQSAPQGEPSAETVREVPEGEGEAQAPSAPTAETPVDWKHKYDVLQGKYNAEVPRLQQQNEGLNSRLGDMEAQMGQLLQSQQAPAAPIEAGSYLTEEERTDYGDDMIAVVKKAAREEFEPVVSQLQSENAQLRGLLGGMQQQNVQSARDTMLTDLDGSMSNWREVNQNQEFLGWLENVDPYSGQKKLDLLRQAFENNNTSRVLAFFKGFLNENAAYTPNQQPGSSAQAQVSLETLVAPGRAADGGEGRAQDGIPQGRVWTQADISGFYRDVNRGVYRNDPDKRASLEADLFAAQSEPGRIAP